MTTTRDSEPLVEVAASDTGPLGSWPGSNLTCPEESEPVSPQARSPVLASSVAVHPEGAVGDFDTERAMGKMAASASGGLRGWGRGGSAWLRAMARSGVCVPG